MLIRALASIAFIPVEADNASEVDHWRILP
jgi:hypothetical protein